MFYFTLTGEIVPANTQELIHFFNCKIIDNNYKDPFTIYLSSVGGDIDSAIRVYDFLKSIPNEIHTVGWGQIDSAAITIFLAGNKRYALEKTRFRIHEPSYNIQQINSALATFEERVKLFKELDKRLKEITALEMGKTLSQINKMYAKGKILSTREAKDLGIVQEIVRDFPKPQT